MNDWTERYNIHTLDLDKKHSLTIRVSWTSRMVDWVTPLNDDGGFTVHFMARTLNKMFNTLPEAKRAGLVLAREVLTQALDVVNQKLNE